MPGAPASLNALSTASQPSTTRTDVGPGVPRREAEDLPGQSLHDPAQESRVTGVDNRTDVGERRQIDEQPWGAPEHVDGRFAW